MEPASQTTGPPAAEQAPPRREPGVARPGVIAFAALLTEIVIIGAACNQWVSPRIVDQIRRSFANGGSQGVRDLKASLLTYNWRFTPLAGDTEHRWLGQVLLVLTVLALTAFLIGVIVRGQASFARVFFTCWVAVVAATTIGTYVRGFVTDSPGSALRITRAVFGPLGPNAFTVLAGLVLGLVVGVVAGWVGMATRRPAVVADEPANVPGQFFPTPEQPPPYYGSPGAPPWQDQHFAPRGRHAAPADETTRLPDVDEATTQLPDAGEATTRFPRPPDDDGLR
jgi:hypothetical protein